MLLWAEESTKESILKSSGNQNVFFRPAASEASDINDKNANSFHPFDLANKKLWRRGRPSQLVLTSTIPHPSIDSDSLLVPQRHLCTLQFCWSLTIQLSTYLWVISHIFSSSKSLLSFLIIFLNPTLINFMSIVLDQNYLCQNHQWPHFTKSKGFSLSYLSYLQHLTQLTNLLLWSPSAPWLSPYLTNESFLVDPL